MSFSPAPPSDEMPSWSPVAVAASFFFVGAALGCSGLGDSEPSSLEARLEFAGRPSTPGAGGELVVSHIGADAVGADSSRMQRTRFIPGMAGVHMEDNDLRGFLDGTFVWGWNQPGQFHVRFGRKASSPQYGEHELFRVIQLWEGVRLPPSARVRAADLTLRVEEGPEHPVQVLLYKVERSWNPGEGGVQKDNVSPPERGEVWWRAARADVELWGLPGVGYASAGPNSDTPKTALADALYEPGDSLLVFDDPGLARYVQQRARAGDPLRFLIKISDAEEDRPRSRLTVFSSNYGGSRNNVRKPTLKVQWSADSDSTVFREQMILEHGRTTTAGPFTVPSGGWIDASFAVSAERYDPPLLELRGGKTSSDTARWRPVMGPIRNDWSWLEVRARALHDPVEIGSPFEFRIHETWALKDPSQAEIRVAFEAPSGRRHVVSPEYKGCYSWNVSFVPNEVGHWRYRWIGDFAESPMVSPVGEFDVVAGTRVQVEEALRRLIADLEEADLSGDDDAASAEKEYLYDRFLGLERALMKVERPPTFYADTNSALQTLHRAREILYGAPMPDSLPLVVSPSHRGRTQCRVGRDSSG